MIVAEVDYDAADALLKRAKWNVKVADRDAEGEPEHAAGACGG